MGSHRRRKHSHPGGWKIKTNIQSGGLSKWRHPKATFGQKQISALQNFNDGHFNTIAKDYYQDESFCKDDDGNINLWNVYNLFTQANKSSYIDTFLERNLNAFEFNQGICKAISGNSDYHWFLS